MPTLEDLSADIRKSDREYIDYVSALDRDQLAEQIDFAFTDGAPGRMSREEMLMHVITHGVGHRGQVSAVMLLNSVTPAKDGFTTYLHEAEASTRRRAVRERSHLPLQLIRAIDALRRPNSDPIEFRAKSARLKFPWRRTMRLLLL